MNRECSRKKTQTKKKLQLLLWNCQINTFTKKEWDRWKCFCAFNTVRFKKRWSSLIYNTSVRHERHECNTSDTSATRALHERQDCDMGEKNLILITTRVKTYFHIPIFTIWQEKDYKERNNFILSTTFGNASFPCQNTFEKCSTKTRLCDGKSYIKKLYTRL